jgi:hypothetical protein
MNANKITVPPSVATAIAHYVTLADTKSEAFTDILSMGFEGARSKVILRHFDGNHDELMEALICGYEVAEESLEAKIIRKYYTEQSAYAERKGAYDGDFNAGQAYAVEVILDILGVKIAGVNAE